MINHARLAARVWKLVDYFEPAVIWELKPSDFEDLDREVLDWYDTVPPDLKIDSIEASSAPIPSGGTKSYDLQRLRIWVRLRYLQVSHSCPLPRSLLTPRVDTYLALHTCSS